MFSIAQMDRPKKKQHKNRHQTKQLKVYKSSINIPRYNNLKYISVYNLFVQNLCFMN